MPQQPADADNANGPSLWVHTEARRRQHLFACHSESPTPRESCTGRGLGGDDVNGQAALKTGDMARTRRVQGAKLKRWMWEVAMTGAGWK